jgi:endopeptidase La
MSDINIEYRRLYLEIYNIMSNINNNFENRNLKKEKYNILMEKIDEILNSYKDLNIDSLNNIDNLYKLRKSIINILPESGCKKISQILSIYLGYNYIDKLSEKYKKLLDFYDNFFVTTSAKIEVNDQSNGGGEPIPYAKKIDGKIQTFVEKIEGAYIYFPFEENIIVVCGYFKKDPLNMCRIGGTLGEKMKRIEEQLNYLSINSNFKIGFLNQLSLRDFILNSEIEIRELIENAHKDLLKYRSKPLSILVKEFITGNSYKQRYILTLFLLSDSEDQFLAHIIYDMVCNTSELLKPQPMAEEVYKSLHYSIQKLFRVAFKNVEDKITQLHSITENDIPYDKRIAMMKIGDNVKARALDKMKEMKGSREGSAKAQQYLDGLLKIPFGIYKKEPVLTGLELFTNKLNGIVANSLKLLNEFEMKTEFENYIYVVIFTILKEYKNEQIESSIESFLRKMEKMLRNISIYNECEIIEMDQKLKDYSLYFIDEILKMKKINQALDEGSDNIDDIIDIDYSNIDKNNIFISIAINMVSIWKEWLLYKKSKKIYLENVRSTLNECVYGHDETKIQLERLIAQWMNGKIDGTVFGFQGPPGVGKTTIAKKGLSKCFLDEDGNPRPFGFLALGGSSNGATLEGHNYTYMGSTWGRIIDILMETKCMNPIIYIDEVDKVSMTEHGREIIGILTHLTDFSQNHEFSDRYFSGIRIDLSKVLFVFSYNDSNALDRILRDRITEINIKALTLNEKIHVVQNYSLPEILDTVGYKGNDILISKEVIKYIIQNYTNEAGVRKLREKLFEIIREINLKRITDDNIHLPYTVSEEYVSELFSDKPKVQIKRIAKEPQIGFVNGLYATIAGTGGLTIVECLKTPSDRKLSLELTGQQGDVMKESMMCAKTLAWNIIPKSIKKEINDEFESYGNFGLHIHCPEAATPKDGPSAGITITTAIISRLCNIKVKNDIAMTGEIDLHGNIHPIGGLEAKLEGAKRAGVRLCLIPKENEEDYLKILKRRKSLDGSPRFQELLPEVIIVSTILEVIKEALVDNNLEFITN